MSQMVQRHQLLSFWFPSEKRTSIKYVFVFLSLMLQTSFYLTQYFWFDSDDKQAVNNFELPLKRNKLSFERAQKVNG